MIGLFRDEEKKLCIDCDGTIIETTLTLLNDKWSVVGFAISQSVTADSMDFTEKQIKIYLDGTEYCINTSNAFDCSDFTLSVGAKNNMRIEDSVFGSYNTNDPLLGQIEMFIISTGIYLSKEGMDYVRDQLFCYSKVTFYDDLSLPVKTEVHKDSTPIVTNTYTYQSDGSKYSTRIKNEQIKLGNNVLTDRTYTMDKRGFITKVTDSVFGTHTYEYDYRGFLTKDNDITYTYDKNGNITKNGSNNLTYSNTIKDRLDSFGSSTCSYAANNQKYGNTTYKYYYSGDKLLVEDTNNYTNRFLYDEKGQLYGFIHNNEDRYFYVRDVMNNILGISSQTGELVVKYNYDAYGKLLSTTGTLASTIGERNPFLYKGYIYDHETQLYYCKSRYYDPNIGRWISPDAPEYLNPTSINGLNLYCYCNNNPIMYYDPNGNIGLIAAVTLIILLSALTSAAIVSVESENYELTGPNSEFSGPEFELSGKGCSKKRISLVSWDAYLEKNSIKFLKQRTRSYWLLLPVYYCEKCDYMIEYSNQCII